MTRQPSCGRSCICLLRESSVLTLLSPRLLTSPRNLSRSRLHIHTNTSLKAMHFTAQP